MPSTIALKNVKKSKKDISKIAADLTCGRAYLSK